MVTRRTFMGGVLALLTLGRLPRAKAAIPAAKTADDVQTWTCTVYIGGEGGLLKRYIGDNPYLTDEYRTELEKAELAALLGPIGVMRCGLRSSDEPR